MTHQFPQPTQIEIVEALQSFQFEIAASDTHIVLLFILPNSHRTIQVPFMRLDFARFAQQVQNAMRRDEVDSTMNGHSLRVDERGT